MQGAFDLKTPQDWFQRLEREFANLRAAPNNRDMVINFFVAAESMLDWKYPGDGNAAVRKAVRDSEPLLLVVWDLASLSKHLAVRQNHKSVDESGLFGEFFDGGFFDVPFFGQLSVQLKGAAAAQFGGSVLAVELAERTMAYWKKNV